jgi:NitT/TauT family transport system substrate-binding protein
MIEAFEGKDLDLGYVGLPPAMIGISRGLKIKCVAGGHVEGTVLVGTKNYRPMSLVKDTLAQFKGKAIGAPRRGSIHDVILKRIISQAGLEGKVGVKNFEWADFILDAMIEGEVDGACGTPPLAALAMHQMDAKVILAPPRLWPNNPSYGIIAAENLIQASPSVLEGFLKLHEDACNFIRERPREAAELVHKTMEIIERDFALEVFRMSPKYCASLPEEYINSTMAFIPALMEMGYLSLKLKKEDIFYTGIIERTHVGKSHYNDPGRLIPTDS